VIVSYPCQVIREETEENRGIHHKLMVGLEQERERAIEIEDSLTLQVEALKKSNKEENHARMILQVSISWVEVNRKMEKEK